MTVQMEGGFRVTGMYVRPKTQLVEMEAFLTSVVEENGNEHFIYGDLNARHSTWDTRCNERGITVNKVLKKSRSAHVCAAHVH